MYHDLTTNDNLVVVFYMFEVFSEHLFHPCNELAQRIIF